MLLTPGSGSNGFQPSDHAKFGRSTTHVLDIYSNHFVSNHFALNYFALNHFAILPIPPILPIDH